MNEERGNSNQAGEEWVRSGIGHSTADTITVCGRDLATELMGEVSFPDLAFMLVTRRQPSADESRMLNAVLVSLTDHGLTPTALAARLTYTGAPESIQGAIAAGLLGGGSVFLGPTEDTARFLQDLVVEERLGTESTEADLRSAAEKGVRSHVEKGRRVPGLGHPVHVDVDPRVGRLFEIAEEGDVLGPHLRLLRVVASVTTEVTGKTLPINGAGAGGAALADLGLPVDVMRGFSLLARTAGLIGHLAEEQRQPLGSRLYQEIDGRMIYDEG